MLAGIGRRSFVYEFSNKTSVSNWPNSCLRSSDDVVEREGRMRDNQSALQAMYASLESCQTYGVAFDPKKIVLRTILFWHFVDPENCDLLYE